MRNSILQTPGKLLLWLFAFFSPTGYFMLSMLADRLHLPSPPDWLAASLFYLIPAAALLVCETLVWRSGMTVARRIVWMVCTLVALCLQVAILLAIIQVATAVATLA